MIIDKIANIEKYPVGNKCLQKAFDYIKKTDLAKLPLGKTVIDGDDIFLKIFEYKPKKDENIEFEFHKKYIDIHIVLGSIEHIWIGHFDDLTNKSGYNEESDVAFGECESYMKLDLRGGYFIVAFPADAHHFEYLDSDKDTVKKLIMKVKI